MIFSMNSEMQNTDEPASAVLSLLAVENQSTSVIKFAGPSIIEAMQEEHTDDESSDSTD